MNARRFPIAVIGAGPIGLAAAAHATLAGERVTVLESGPSAASNVQSWQHVQLFSPWEYNIDAASKVLLERHGWTAPSAEHYPTGAELVAHYLSPLAETPELKPHIRYGARVTAISRFGADKLKTAGRDALPFVVEYENPDGSRSTLLAKAVIDASGTVRTPNPVGASGIMAIGEAACSDRIVYGIPDLLGRYKDRYVGKTIAVIGSGHSAFNALLDAAKLKEQEPSTQVVWVVRRQAEDLSYGGGKNDALAARGRLGSALHAVVEKQLVTIVDGFRVTRLTREAGRIVIEALDERTIVVDEIIATTGFRPNLEMLSELRLSLDPAVEAPTELAPLIDPNEHSCGTVRPHGARELSHPEHHFYIAGMKSYGRAPTFLMLTGYEQVRSIIAIIVGDIEASERVELVLPETGVCSTDRGGTSSSCGEGDCAEEDCATSIAS